MVSPKLGLRPESPSMFSGWSEQQPALDRALLPPCKVCFFCWAEPHFIAVLVRRRMDSVIAAQGHLCVWLEGEGRGAKG
jgi:hypothetical protein